MSKAWDIRQLERITESKNPYELQIVKKGMKRDLTFLKIKLDKTKDERERQVLEKQISQLKEDLRIVIEYLNLFQKVSPDQEISFETKN